MARGAAAFLCHLGADIDVTVARAAVHPARTTLSAP